MRPRPLLPPRSLPARLGLCAAGLLSGLSACGSERPETASATTPPAAIADWRSVATREDRARLRDWRSIWVAALASARAGGAADKIAAAGVLLDPDAALANPDPPPGDYTCRVTKVGAQGKGMLPFVLYPPFRCRVSAEGATLHLSKLTGSQRPQGLLYRDGDLRSVFLGSLVLGDERTAQAYGRDGQRDMAGLVERIGPRRWRLALPRPAWESLLDVIEFTPAG